MTAGVARLVCREATPWRRVYSLCLFFFNDTATTEIYTLSLHDALPICPPQLERTAQQRRAAYRREWRGYLGVGDPVAYLAHSWVLSFGVTRMVATSASRLSITYTAAISMASAWTTGRSWLITASWIAPPMPEELNTISM